jgi:hypothetical protein
MKGHLIVHSDKVRLGFHIDILVQGVTPSVKMGISWNIGISFREHHT